MRLASKLLILSGISTAGLGIAVYETSQSAVPHFAAITVSGEGIAAPEARRVSISRPALGSYGEIAARPVFSPDRRPPADVEAVEAEPEPAALPAIALTGITVAGTRRRALVRFADQAPELVSVGDLLAGWRLMALDDASARFERAGTSYTAHLGEPAPGNAASGAERSGGGQQSLSSDRNGNASRDGVASSDPASARAGQRRAPRRAPKRRDMAEMIEQED